MKVHFENGYLHLVPETESDKSGAQMLQTVKGIYRSGTEERPEYRWDIAQLFDEKKTKKHIPTECGTFALGNTLSTGSHIVSFHPKDNAAVKINCFIRKHLKKKLVLSHSRAQWLKRMVRWVVQGKKDNPMTPVRIDVSSLYYGSLPVMEMKVYQGPLIT